MIISEPGNYTLLYTAEDSCGNKTEATRPLTVKSVSQVFGAMWDGSDSTTWTRTDASADFADPQPAVANGTGSSPFDDIMPWSGMQIVEDEEAGTLVSIPKFWYKWTIDGDSMKLQIANGAEDGFLVSPAHADRGDGSGERDVVYVGRYHCCDTNYKSVTGIVPKTNVSRRTSRQNIHALGDNVWQYDFAMYWTICMLYIVEFADWNSQAVIGYGCGNNSAKEVMGATDAMQYHTGTNTVSKTTYGQIQYRHIEGLWSNVYDWCDGIYFNGASVYGINKPSDFSDTENGTLIGARPTNSGVPQTFNEPAAIGYEYALYPKTAGGTNYTARTCDRCGYISIGVVLYVGGSYSQSQFFGLFFLGGGYSASDSLNNIGTRLQKLP